MKKTFLLLGWFFLFTGSCLPVLAEDIGDELDLLGSLDIEEDYVYEFPEIPPTAHFHMGYRFIDPGTANQVFEYEYPDSFVTFGTELKMFPFPNRFFLDVDFINSKDYFADLRYAYGDLVLFRWLNNTFYHNLENIRLYDFSTLPHSPLPNPDAGREYGVNARENKFQLIVKAPRFPLHAYLDGFYMVKDGDRQQRNMLGTGLFNNMIRTSRSRNLDTSTRIYKVGVNSHLGFVEADFAHIEKRFNVDSEPSLQDYYSPSIYRPAGGVFEHSRIPELEGSGNLLKVHSSYSGAWVASASLYQNKRENNYSGAESDVIIGGASLMWTPLTSLSFAFRYTHRDLDNESPATVTVTKLDTPVDTFTYAVRPPVSSQTDTASIIGRYKPLKGLTFRAKYNYQQIDRTNAALWNLESTTRKNGLTLTADSRLHSKVLFNVKYAYQNVSDPSYNTEPEHSHNARLGLTWLPHPDVNFLFSYDMTHQERDNLDFSETNEPWYRETDQDHVMALGTYQVSKKFTVSASYSFLHYRVLQDIAYYPDPYSPPEVDRNVPMKQRSHVLTFSAYYHFTDALSLQGGVTATRNEGKFSPNSADLLEPVSIASFTQMEQRYLLFHLGGEYRFDNGMSLELDYHFGDFEDVLDNSYDHIEDGEAHIVVLSATKKW